MGTSALAYARIGWPVLPLHSIRNGACTCGVSTCTRPGKHPRTRNGVHDATTDPSIIRKWFADWPDANIGVAAGTRSGLLVVDVDPRNGGVRTLRALEAKYGSLRGTLTAQTGGGGRHFVFKHPSFKISRHTLGAGIDVLSDNQYFVAPPSRHQSGHRYTWLPGRSPSSKEGQP
jgi:Bifunctional DNA primase/polymerase, N-terminal